jgi:hypothetical protein
MAITETHLLSSSHQSLSLHPFGDDAIDFLRLLPEQPVRGVDILGGQLRDVVTHLVGKLICDDGIAESPHEQSWALNLDAVLDRQQWLVGLEVGLAVAVVVAWV